ncbi:unnamed protein product [Ixodes pacificus]
MLIKRKRLNFLFCTRPSSGQNAAMSATMLFLIGGSLLSSLVLQVVVASNPLVFDLEAKIQEYVEKLEEKHNVGVAWWDMYGTNPEFRWYKLPKRPHKVLVKAGPIKYGEAKTRATKPRVLHTEWIHNEQPSEASRVTVQRYMQHETKYTWTTQKGIGFKTELSATVPLPGSVSITGTISVAVSFTKTDSKVKTESEEHFVKHVITVPPRKSVKVEWVINDIVQEIPWTAEIRARGNFAVAYTRPVNGSILWFYHISKIQDPLLKPIGGGQVQFMSSGTFTSVGGSDTRLQLTQFDLIEEDKPQSNSTTYSIPLDSSVTKASFPHNA